jgi:hypothetical protein
MRRGEQPQAFVGHQRRLHERHVGTCRLDQAAVAGGVLTDRREQPALEPPGMGDDCQIVQMK